MCLNGTYHVSSTVLYGASQVVLVVENPPVNAGDIRDMSLIPESRSPGGGHGNPLQYSWLEEFLGQRSLEGYSPWGHKESDKTEGQSIAQHSIRY